MDYALNTASKNYDAFKGEQFAIAADGKEKDRQQKPSFRSGTMDKQSFLSSKPIEDVNRYMVCVLQDREIHATPVRGIVSMRQVFSYFDKQDKRTKAEQKAEQDADADEEELKQVTVKFARTENEKVRKAREKSFNYISKMESEEPWCESFWHTKKSTTAELERQKLFCSSASRVDGAESALNVGTTEYLDMLISKEKTDRNIDSMLPSRVVCMHKLKQMNLVDQIKVILKDGKCCKICPVLFNQMYFSPSSSKSSHLPADHGTPPGQDTSGGQGPSIAPVGRRVDPRQLGGPIGDHLPGGKCVQHQRCPG